MLRKSRGFTLLELLVVVVIIGLLAAFVAPKYFGQIGRSRTQISRAQIESFEKAMDQYRIDVGRYPETSQGLVALVVAPPNTANWRGPYLKKGIPKDPWGKEYIFKSPVNGSHEYEISTLGGDGAKGGADENADVQSWD